MLEDLNRVELELTGSAVEKASSSALAMVFGQAMIAIIAWVYLSAALALTILSSAVLVAVWRRVLAHKWAECSKTAAGCRRVRRSFLGMVSLLAATNVLAVAAVYPRVPPQAAALVLIVILASLTVAALFLTLVQWALLIWLLPPLIVTIVVSLIQADGFGYALAAAAPIYGLVTARAAREQLAAATAQVRQRLELEAAASSLVVAKQRAEAASIAKSRFLATMSHEIRTPMNGLIGTLDLLANTPFPAAQRRLLDTAIASSSALLDVINDVLDFSSIEAGKLVLRESEFSPSELAHAAAALFSAAAESKAVRLSVDVSPLVPDRLLGDPTRTRQILLNLLGNAVKFTEQGEIVLSVRLDEVASPADGQANIVFIVRDSGIGIDAAWQPLLFQPFSQGDQSTTRRYGGTGLGLALARQLAEAMHGTIEFQSSTRAGASGSTFTVRIAYRRPLRECIVAEGGEGWADTRPAVPLIPMPTSAVVDSPGRLLLVDDNAVNRLVGKEMLSSLGFEVVEAADGREALAELESGDFDLVLMDCQMPVMDGFAATRAIRDREQAEHLPRTPIIAVTANAFEGDADDCYAAGMDAYLAKPFSLAQLRAAIGQRLRKVA